MTQPAFVKLAAEIFRAYVVDGVPGSGPQKPVKADIRAYLLMVEAALNASISFPSGIINGKLTVVASGNALVVSVKTNAGNDPSATDPVYAIVRSATITDNGYSVVALIAATSFTVTLGSTLGVLASTPFSVEIVGINDGGTFRLGVINRNVSGNVIATLDETRPITSTAEGGAGAADSAGIVYTGTAVAAKAFRVLARAQWFTGLGTPGTWSASPDAVLPVGAAAPRLGERSTGHLFGLTLSNNTGDAVNDIDIAAGVATADGDPDELVLPASITKRLDAAWAVGTAQGGRDTGAISDAWWYVWLIKRSDTGVVDVLFSLSATAPTMPASYDKKRRIGAINRASSALLAFKQNDDVFTLDVPVNNASASNPGTAAVARAVTAPPAMIAIFVYWLNNVTTAAVQVLITEIAQTDTTPTTTLFHLRATATSQVVMGEFRRKTDASSQVRFRHQASGASDAIVLTSVGWVDTRGRLS